METLALQLTDEQKRDKVVEVCQSVYDPEIPVNVFELGLIYEVNIFPINNCYVSMTLTSPACPSAQELPNEVKTKVVELGIFNDVNVEITFDPPWSQDMMSETAKLELGFM